VGPQAERKLGRPGAGATAPATTCAPTNRSGAPWSGNYGSGWGQGYHVRTCAPGLLNQFCADDWPAHGNADVYSALKETVGWGGWDYFDSKASVTSGQWK